MSIKARIQGRSQVRQIGVRTRQLMPIMLRREFLHLINIHYECGHLIKSQITNIT